MTSDPHAAHHPPVLVVAIVAYHGVLADESDAFRAVLGRMPGARVITVGPRTGPVAGPGGAQVVDATFADLQHVDVVAVPGGLGSHRHPEIALWLLRTRPRWVLASSTGSALLAAAGLLRGRTAATHWLAGPLLECHGVTPSTDRLVIDDPYVTCAGLASTFDAAFVVVGAIGGRSLVDSIRGELTHAVEYPAPCLPPRTRYRARPARQVVRTPAVPPRPPGRRQPDRPLTRSMVEVELEEHAPIRRPDV
jgi:transcriptional regulator GlxA family with amidase domain